MGKMTVFRAKCAVAYVLTAIAVVTTVMACGGGGNNTAPTLLQVNPTTPWELITAGDIAQCNPLRSSADSNAHKTAEIRAMIGDRFEVVNATAFPDFPGAANRSTTPSAPRI